MKAQLTINNAEDFAIQLRTFRNKARESGVRAVSFVRFAPENWLASFADQHGYHYVHDQSRTDRNDRITAVLGSEQSNVAIQLGSSPDLGLLAALAGTVTAGGICLIGIPGNNTAETNVARHHSLKRLTVLSEALANRHPANVLHVQYSKDVNGNRAASFNPSTQTRQLQDYGLPGNGVAKSYYMKDVVNPAAVAEQAKLLNKAFQHIQSSERSCTVIVGRRGRGKSTLMGRLATQLADEGIPIKVTALHESALSAYRMAAPTRKHYLSPETAAGNPPDTLLIDEAASFPIARLQHYARTCRHLILSTTVDGYESAGRALALRFASDDEIQNTNVLWLEPVQPWRWAVNDPLEEFVDSLLLTPAVNAGFDMNPERQPETQRQLTNHAGSLAIDTTKQYAPRCISREELLSSETLLAAVQTLLSANHYQSSTRDLQHLLDATSMSLWIQQHEGCVAGVLLLEHEGQLDVNLHEPILAKQRRLPNQLLPQLLAQTANCADALTKRYIRVLRLAVSPYLRRQGLASALVDTVMSHYRSDYLEAHAQGSVMNTIEAIGASFAADDGSIKFWRSQGFEEFHRGYKRNPRTGKQAVAVMRSFDPTCSRVLNKAVAIHRDNEHARCTAIEFATRENTRCPPAPGKKVTDETRLQAGKSAFVAPSRNTSGTTTTISSTDRKLLSRFAAGERTRHDTYAALHRLASNTSLAMSQHNQLSRRQQERELREHVQQWLLTH